MKYAFAETIGNTVIPSTGFFSEVFDIVAPVSTLVVAFACVGLLLTVVRAVMCPDDDQVAASMTQIRRILVISVFLGMLGMIISWVFGGLDVTIFGFNMRPGVWNMG